MRATFGITLAAVIFGFGAAAQPSHTNAVDRASAIKAAARLTIGMREEVAEKILATNGLRNPLKMGCSHGWICFSSLADHSSLGIEIRPKRASADGAWADGL